MPWQAMDHSSRVLRRDLSPARARESIRPSNPTLAQVELLAQAVAFEGVPHGCERAESTTRCTRCVQGCTRCVQRYGIAPFRYGKVTQVRA